MICSGRCARPERALRRCLVGTPPSCVDEVCGACARMVAAGVFDADAMCGELLAALAASHASATTDRRRLGDECRVARALVRGIAGVVALSIDPGGTDCAGSRGGGSGDSRGGTPARRLAEWVGPKHPLARALRAHPTGAPPAVLAAVARISGHGPDSAAALAGVPNRVALRALRPFLRHALLSENNGDARGFRDALHAHLVRVACGEGVDSESSLFAATLLAGCLPWYRTNSTSTGADRTRHMGWVSHARAADVADALERAAAGVGVLPFGGGGNEGGRGRRGDGDEEVGSRRDARGGGGDGEGGAIERDERGTIGRRHRRAPADARGARGDVREGRARDETRHGETRSTNR